jgi:hypothetical protein
MSLIQTLTYVQTIGGLNQRFMTQQTFGLGHFGSRSRHRSS